MPLWQCCRANGRVTDLHLWNMVILICILITRLTSFFFKSFGVKWNKKWSKIQITNYIGGLILIFSAFTTLHTIDISGIVVLFVVFRQTKVIIKKQKKRVQNQSLRVTFSILTYFWFIYLCRTRIPEWLRMFK